MRKAQNQKRLDYRGLLNFFRLKDSATKLTGHELGGLLQWGHQLRLGCRKKQLPAACKLVEWIGTPDA